MDISTALAWSFGIGCFITGWEAITWRIRAHELNDDNLQKAQRIDELERKQVPYRLVSVTDPRPVIKDEKAFDQHVSEALDNVRPLPGKLRSIPPHIPGPRLAGDQS